LNTHLRPEADRLDREIGLMMKDWVSEEAAPVGVRALLLQQAAGHMRRTRKRADLMARMMEIIRSMLADERWDYLEAMRKHSVPPGTGYEYRRRQVGGIRMDLQIGINMFPGSMGILVVN